LWTLSLLAFAFIHSRSSVRNYVINRISARLGCFLLDPLQMGVELVHKPFRNPCLQDLVVKQIHRYMIQSLVFPSNSPLFQLIMCINLSLKGLNKDLPGIIVNGSPNSLAKKSWAGILHMFKHIPTRPLFSKLCGEFNSGIFTNVLMSFISFSSILMLGISEGRMCEG